MNRRLFLSLLPVTLLAPRGICLSFNPSFSGNPNFSGTWKQSNERSTPTRTGEVTLKIEHRDPELTVQTLIVDKSGSLRHALQHYTTDTKTSMSTGADGDEFYTSVSWNGQSLVFSIEEHEDGRVIPSHETWTLIENGDVLERKRSRADGPSQTILYLREVTPP